MEYTEGCLAFLDILGFSHYVGSEENFEKTYKLFEFVKKYCWFFNTSPQLKVEVSFFSDTVVITAKEFENLIIPIYMAESFLKKELGLLFRGGIVYGKYYHKDDTTFGPAVVAGYALEKSAVYSRILIGDNVVSEDDSLFHFVDIDGYRCLNPFGTILTEILASAPDGIVYPENITQQIVERFEESRCELLEQISRNKGTPVIDKYLWRIRAYNYTCKYVIKMPNKEIIYPEVNYMMNEELRKAISNMVISLDEL